MRRLLNLTFVFAAFLAPAASAQTLLPASLPGWNSTNSVSATPGSLQTIAGPSAPAIVEYGATAAEERTYARGDNPRKSLAVTAYSFRDASGAYGAYSFLLTPEMRPADYSDHSARSRDRALILMGNTLLDASGSDIASDEPAIKTLGASLGELALAPIYPSLPLRIPTKDFISRTDHYFLGPVALARFWPDGSASGDWLGFSRGAEAEIAKYRLKGGEATLLVIDYPTPQIAASQLDRMTKEFQINSRSAVAGTGGLYARRDGSLVGLVAGAPSEAAANSLLGRIQSDVVLTWDEPVLKHPLPSMPVIVVGTIIATGEMCVFAVIAGIVFAFVRLGVKRLLPGKVFDRPEQFEILQLGLSSKPIKGRDFY